MFQKLGDIWSPSPRDELAFMFWYKSVSLGLIEIKLGYLVVKTLPDVVMGLDGRKEVTGNKAGTLKLWI